MERSQWLAERRKGVGGSDAPVVAGLSPWKSPLALYFEKRGEVPDEELGGLEHIRWGNRLEDAIADEYMERTGRKVRRVNKLLQHREHPFMLASLDRNVVGEPRILEIKTTGEHAYRMNDWGEPGTDEVPEYYMLQVQHYLSVTGYEVGDLAVLVGGQKMHIYEIQRDDELIEALIDIEREFWDRVQAGDPPDTDWHAAGVLDLVKRRYPGTNGQKIILPEEALEVHEALLAAKQMEKEAKAEKDALTAKLLDMVGENAVGVLPGGIGSYRRSLRAEAEVSYTRKAYVDFRYSKSTEV